MDAATIQEHLTLDPRDLRLYEGNARQGDVGAICESLQRLGQYRPIVVNRGTLTGRPWEVLAGNHTVQAALALGWESMEATIVDVDDDTARRVVLVDNRTNDLASNDDAALVALLQALDQDYSGTGYDGDDLDDLLRLAQYGDAPATDPNAEWTGMPEFVQEDQTGVRQLIVHFKTDEAVKAFEKVWGHTLTDKTKSCWFPYEPWDFTADMQYKGEDDAE